MRTWSTMLRMSSTLLLEAASSSNTLNDIASSCPSKPLMALAKMRAEVVFPTPRGPQKR